MIIPKSLLLRMKKAGLKFGIVTGRNDKEADMALNRFKIKSLFDARTTLDDTPPNRKKPDPYGLLRVASLLGKNLNYLYVGDLPDDVISAERSKKQIKIKSCGFIQTCSKPSEMKKHLKAAGADYICKNAAELSKIIFA